MIHLCECGCGQTPSPTARFVRGHKSCGDPVERFWRHVDKNGPWLPHVDTPCWVWTGSTNGADRTGYGSFRFGSIFDPGGSKSTSAHRFSWELVKGRVPPQRELDHRCRNTLCVRPDHLEVVTRRMNLLRGLSPCAINARKRFCPQGHPYDEDNTRVDSRNQRNCRTCDRNRWSRRSQKRPASDAFEEVA